MLLSRAIDGHRPARPKGQTLALCGESANFYGWRFSRTSQWKALLLLTVFAANFMVVCHCSARSLPAEHSCCKKKTPCKDDNSCGGMQAVKFNLLEKQTSDPVAIGDVYVSIKLFDWQLTAPEVTYRIIPDSSQPIHSPPDRQSLYQCFLI